MTHFPALKESFYSLWLNCCHISLTATGRWKPSVMFSATCRLIIVGRCAWSRWSNQTRCPHFVPGGETIEGFGRCFTFLVAISLTPDRFHQTACGWQSGGTDSHSGAHCTDRTNSTTRHQTMHRIPGAGGDCGRSWRVDGASTGATAAAQAHAHTRVHRLLSVPPI